MTTVAVHHAESASVQKLPTEEEHPMPEGHRLRVGESLRRQSLTSLNDAFTLKHFGFDDLILIRNHDREPLWWSSAFSPADEDWGRKRRGHGVSDVTLQPDGNLVAHDEDGTPLWSTDTAGRDVELLEVRGDGDVVLLDSAGEIVWHTDTATANITPSPFSVARGDRMLVGQSLADQSLTSPNGQYVLVHDHQHGGTFLYGPHGRITSWFYLVPSGYPDPFGTRLSLEEDGLFLRWSKDEVDQVDLRGVRKAWDSLTTPRSPFHPKQVVVRDNGDLEMLDADGEIMWRNGYKREHPKFAKSSNQPQARTSRKRTARRPAVPAVTPQLPSVESVPLIRTDFSNNDAWATTCTQVTTPRHFSGGDTFSADVEPVDNAAFAELTAAQLLELVPAGTSWAFLLVADIMTMESAEHHVLVVDLDDDSRGRTFRATPPAVQEIENNLSLANMDWEDFADSADEDGVVRPMLAEVTPGHPEN
ncbi:DUF6924 domain-containing protein [Amycolatopsis sp. EV170708-02-1]|uniref:DUF6924 domain-containing protein n=1 Tax=Amycolatopsis sp. EV170708-02-1 TaxID=2919322 RepID=UPI001F0BA974|nr:hypothetical protein [Amycolatopsis sp. EV170708-02-1]UMP06734.1 hypothetical protein MJQ72_18830 [Amycolatopsis sp. EV170708-02-1]